ncbi:hypothetical protein GWI33_002861 [Rhynchophorus ferrugineus]|uniref:Uncharacterized protein n=1 Tax=Rhynchophorus ferrugineus TaxID=354439 RepID=A0A834MHD8_RHYFE|nr:hypothetical protein GWI33_002861 [Rhynchophorus ferrugineus]
MDVVFGQFLMNSCTLLQWRSVVEAAWWSHHATHSTISTLRLTNLIILSFELDLRDAVDIDSAVKHFATKKTIKCRSCHLSSENPHPQQLQKRDIC